MIVPDASSILEILLRTPNARAIEERLLDDRETLHAPHLLDLEIAQVLRRYVMRGDILPERAKASLDIFSKFPILRYSHEPLVDRIWALRASLTAYDAAYVALAEGLSAPLVTCDAKLAAARGHRANIELF